MGITEQGRYQYMDDLLQLQACVPVDWYIRWPRCPSPVSIGCLACHLHWHPDREFSSYILRGFTEGFRVGFAYQKSHLWSRLGNLPSSLANPGVINDDIAKERDEGRLVGPVNELFLSRLQVSPIGLVPKGHTNCRWRVIVNLLAPQQFSVNDGIEDKLCSLTYASLDDAVRLISSLGWGTQLVKMDLKDAYQIVPVHPKDQHLLGISWEGAVYVDHALPFRLCSATKIFTAVVDSFARALHSSGIRHVLNYLDDFLFIGTPNSAEALQAARLAMTVFSDMDIPVATHKTEGPSSCVTFLGIQIDTVAGQLYLPSDKLHRVREQVQSWLQRGSHTRKDFESLLGHLSHATMVIRPGRAFLRALFALLAVAPKPYHYVSLNVIARGDLRW